MTLKINKIYLTVTVFLFIIEILIAIYLKTGFIRHTFGDFLVVILIYSFFKSFINLNSFYLAIGTLVFAYLIEFLQMANLLNILGLENNAAAKLILGSTFQITDLVAYTLGVLCVLFFEIKFKNT